MPKPTLQTRDRAKERALEKISQDAAELRGERRGGRQNISASLPRDLAERAKNAVYWTRGLSLSRLVAESLAKGIAKLEKENGEPFPQRPGELTRGPAIDYRKV